MSLTGETADARISAVAPMSSRSVGTSAARMTPASIALAIASEPTTALLPLMDAPRSRALHRVSA